MTIAAMPFSPSRGAGGMGSCVRRYFRTEADTLTVAHSEADRDTPPPVNPGSLWKTPRGAILRDSLRGIGSKIWATMTGEERR